MNLIYNKVHKVFIKCNENIILGSNLLVIIYLLKIQNKP